MFAYLANAARRLVPYVLLFSLAACGGGGGGGGGWNPFGKNDDYTVSPTTISFTAAQNSGTPSPQQASVRVNSGTVYIRVDYSGAAIDYANFQLTGSTTGVITINPVSSNRSPGTYTGTVTVYGCADQYCSSSVSGSPKVISVTYVIQSGIAVSPTSLNFSYVSGGAVPPTQNVSVTGSTPTSWTATVSQPWVTLGSTSGTTPSTVGVTVNPAGLAVGTYNATITFNTSIGISRTVSVSLTVSPQVIAVSPPTMTYSYTRGAAAPATQSLTVAGTVGLNWTASADQGWVNLSSASGTTPSTINIGVDPSGLAAGTYNSTVTFTSGALTASTTVWLTVADPELTVNQTSLTFSGVNGAPITSQTLNIALSNGAADTWNASTSAGWLVVGQASGTTPGTVTVSVNPATGPLASGTHSGTITITAVSAGVALTRTVNVTLNLTLASLSITPSQITLGGSDGRSLIPQTLQLSLNAGTNTYAWSATPSAGWMQATPSGGPISSIPVTVSLSPSLSGVVGGTYNGSLNFSVPVNGDIVTRALPVTLNLSAHKLLVADNGVALVSAPTVSKLNHSVLVRDNFDLAAVWTATSDQAWLSVTASGNGGDQLALTANPAGLASDTIHYATVTISSSDATVENTETVHVGLWVTGTDPTPTTTGPIGPWEVVSDPIRPYAYSHTFGTDITVYNVYSGALVGTISSVAARLGSMAVSNDGQQLWAIDLNNFRIVPVDLTNWNVGTAWDLSNAIISHPRLAYARTNGQAVVIATDGRLYDAGTGTPRYTYMTPSFDADFRVVASLKGNVFCYPTCRSLDYSDLNGGNFVVGPLLPSSLGSRDGAINADGTRVYSASGWPYECTGRDVTTGLTVQTLPVGAYPENVEIGPDGKIFCGKATAVFTGDYAVYVYTSGGVEVGRYLPADGGLLERQLAISGDGVRMITISDRLRFTTVGP